MIDLFNYSRRESSVARVGDIEIGGKNPIRVQSMTTTDTNDKHALNKQNVLYKKVVNWYD